MQPETPGVPGSERRARACLGVGWRAVIEGVPPAPGSSPEAAAALPPLLNVPTRTSPDIMVTPGSRSSVLGAAGLRKYDPREAFRNVRARAAELNILNVVNILRLRPLEGMLMADNIIC